MLKSDARVHAVVWMAAAQKALPRATDDNETARIKRVVSALAGEVGKAYAAVSEGNHPLTGEPLTNE